MAASKWIGPVGNPAAPILCDKPDRTWQAKHKARLGELAREAANRREGLQKIVDDATLDELAELAGVPQENRSVFYSLVRRAVKELRRGMKANHPQPRRKPILAALDEYQAAVDKVRELLTPEYAAATRADAYLRKAHKAREYVSKACVSKACKKEHELLTADDTARTAVLACLRGDEITNVIIGEETTTFTCDWKDKGAGEVIADGTAFLDNLSCAFKRAKRGLDKAYKDKGRPHSAQGDAAIDLFLSNLIFSIRKMGGHIATSRPQATSPTHIGKAVKILRPFLPGNFPVIESLERKFETIGTKKARPFTKKSAKKFGK